MRPFNSIPDLISNEALLELYYKVRSGDEHVRAWAADCIIKGNIAQALYVCKLRSPKVIGRDGSWRVVIKPDMLGEAMLQLVESVDAIKNGAIDHHTTPNIRGYLTVALHGRLRRHHVRDRLMWVDPATYKKLEAAGHQFSGVITLPDIEKPTKGDLSEMIANRELLKLTVFSDFEKQVVEARLRGETDPKIAEQLNCSKQHVHQTRQRIQKRILEKLNGHGSVDREVRATEREATTEGSLTGNQ
jgi:hypothetical protein